jgi:hypothetical protein
MIEAKMTMRMRMMNYYLSVKKWNDRTMRMRRRRRRRMIQSKDTTLFCWMIRPIIYNNTSRWREQEEE